MRPSIKYRKSRETKEKIVCSHQVIRGNGEVGRSLHKDANKNRNPGLKPLMNVRVHDESFKTQKSIAITRYLF